MKKSDALLYFGGVNKIAEALGIGKSAVSQWEECPPPLRQIQIEHLTGRFLKADSELFQTETELERTMRRKAYRAAIKQTMRRRAA